MSLSNHIEELKRKHKSLKNKITNAQNNLSNNHSDITLMKKMKLKLKEELYRMEEKYN